MYSTAINVRFVLKILTCLGRCTSMIESLNLHDFPLLVALSNYLNTYSCNVLNNSKGHNDTNNEHEYNDSRLTVKLCDPLIMRWIGGRKLRRVFLYVKVLLGMIYFLSFNRTKCKTQIVFRIA